MIIVLREIAEDADHGFRCITCGMRLAKKLVGYAGRSGINAVATLARTRELDFARGLWPRKNAAENLI
jgi:hypothetical protein